MKRDKVSGQKSDVEGQMAETAEQQNVEPQKDERRET
jgi:hypothetical protein